MDADGVNNLAGDYTGLKDAAAPRILTPHPGEMARLVGPPPPRSRPGAWTWPGKPQPDLASSWC